MQRSPLGATERAQQRRNTQASGFLTTNQWGKTLKKKRRQYHSTIQQIQKPGENRVRLVCQEYGSVKESWRGRRRRRYISWYWFVDDPPWDEINLSWLVETVESKRDVAMHH
jgi:hypothetical protein